MHLLLRERKKEMVYIKFPVHANVGLAVEEDTDVAGFLEVGAPASPAGAAYSVPSKTWVHPGHASDPRNMVAAVARARGLINRTTASTVAQSPPSATSASMSVPAHVARLASKWELVAYTVEGKDVAREIAARGPLLASVRITGSLLNAVSARLLQEEANAPQFATPDDTADHGTIIVALLGWDEESNWIVGLPWGKFVSPAWDGTLPLPASTVTNVCGIAKQEHVSPSAPPTSNIQVSVLPPSWDPPTTQPLPEVAHVGSVSGKQKPLRPKKKVRPAAAAAAAAAAAPASAASFVHTLSSWMTEEHMNVTVQCSVTLVVIIVGILTLLLMRRPRA